MKVLIVNESDLDGGAARAAYRLHKSLLAQKIDSQMLVQNKYSNDFTILSENKKIYKYFNKIRPLIDSILVRPYKNRVKLLFSPSWFGFSNIIKTINKINPDIVHLHWINGGMIKIEHISKIKPPIVWTLHDNWAFTGGCHLVWECNKYKTLCGNCPKLQSNRNYDLSRKIFNRKKKTFNKKSNINIVGLSEWLTNISKQSSLFSDKNHITLPNPIDTNVFKPSNKIESRNLWNFPKNRKLLLFGAMDSTKNINKGFKELCESINKLEINLEIEIIIFGNNQPPQTPNLNFKTYYLGKLFDDISIISLYSAVDVVVIPSKQESFGQVASEAMACGTPVVAFATTGLLDIVNHKENGYLAKPFDTTDLKDGIKWVLYNNNYQMLCQNARNKVVTKFNHNIVAKQYIDLYKSIL